MTYYAVINRVTNTVDYLESEELANAKLIENQTAYLNAEAYRFTICKEIVSGNDTTWLNADLNNDPEEAVYHVFNTKTGLHEQVQGLSNAKKRLEAIKQEFIVDNSLHEWAIVDSIPTPKFSYSETKFGPTIGDIPVEVM